MQPLNQIDMRTKLEARLRTIRILWFALFMSVIGYYVFAKFLIPPNENAVPNGMLSLILTVVGSLSVVVSLLVKQRFLTQSLEQQRLDLVQKGYVVACAFSEVAALLGLVDHFVTGNRYFYVLFIIAGCGMLLHFPRREDVQNACVKVDGFNQVRDF
jgi:hypothetical protein